MDEIVKKDGAGSEVQSESNLRDFFVKLTSPVSFRRGLLESSKSILSILKEMYRLDDVRFKKKDAIQRLKKEMEEIRMLIQKLEDRMPQYNKDDVKKYFPKLDLERKELKKIVKVENVDPGQSPFTQDPESNVDPLSRAIANVEQRMSTLPPEEPKYIPKPQMSVRDDHVDELGKALNELKRKLSNF